MVSARVRRQLATAVAVLALSTSCQGGGGDDEPTGPSRYGSSDTSAVPDATNTTASAASPGSVVAPGAPTTRAPAPPPEDEPAADAAAPSPPRTTKATVENRTERLDPNGLELVLVVADKVHFAPNEDITMELSFVNRGAETMYRYGAQEDYFELIGADRLWSTTSCQPDFGGQRPPPSAIAIEPGEPNRFVGTYPGARGSASRESCRLPAGEYDVYGIVDWCPPDTVTRPGGGGPACDPARVVPVRSEPLRISIG